MVNSRGATRVKLGLAAMLAVAALPGCYNAASRELTPAQQATIGHPTPQQQQRTYQNIESNPNLTPAQKAAAEALYRVGPSPGPQAPLPKAQ